MEKKQRPTPANGDSGQESGPQNPLSEGLLPERTPEPLVMVIFGASGDLTHRKLLPALYTMARERLLPAAFAVVGFARRDIGQEGFRKAMRDGCDTHARRRPVDPTLWDSFSQNIHYHQGDFNDPEAFQRLKEKLDAIDQELGIPGNRLFYLATPPSAYPEIIKNLGAANLVKRSYSPFTRIIVEKPFGTDLETARVLNRQLKQVFRETQIFRIDHYLGKENVQNLLVFRFANGIFEPLWNQRYVDHVQITAAETIGVEGRGGYYEEAGILRDMVQNHLFQVMCLVAMEPPVAMDADSVRNEKVKLLKSLRPIIDGALDEHVVRAQYGAGSVMGKKVEGYRQEGGVAPESVTETFVALKLFIDNWRWADVPFYLRAGKRMPKRVTEISIHFRQAPHYLFGQTANQRPAANILSIRIQPNEGISLHFGAKTPGPITQISPVNMEFRYGTSFGQEPPEAYERLILDAMLGDPTLFTRDDETETSWGFITRILEGWGRQKKRAIPFYESGSWGPPEAEELLDMTDNWRSP